MSDDFIASYIDLDSLTSADLQPFFNTLDTIQLMTIVPPQFTYEDWSHANFDPKHYHLWMKTYAGILKRFPTAREALTVIPNHMLSKFFQQNGMSPMDLWGFSREDTFKLLAHFCIEFMKKRGQWRE